MYVNVILLQKMRKYTKPLIAQKKVKKNFFSTNTRFFDSFNSLAPSVFAQSSSAACEPSGSSYSCACSACSSYLC